MELVARPARQLMDGLAACDLLASRDRDREVEVLAEAHSRNARPHVLEQVGHALVQELGPAPVRLPGHAFDRLLRKRHRIAKALRSLQLALHHLEAGERAGVVRVIAVGHVLHAAAQRFAFVA